MIWLLCIGAAAARGEVRVQDYQDRLVSLPKPAARIVALAPHVVENLYAAGAGDKIVGVVEYSDFPAAARHKARVGGHSAVSLEAIVALAPDLVIAWAAGTSSALVQRLLDLGITVYLDDPRRLADVARSLRDFGTLAGTASVSEPRARNYLRQLDTLRTQFVDKKPVTVLYQVWHEPLQTLNGKHIITDVIELCGGRNVFDDAVSLAPKISLEAVFQRNPDVIIASGMGTARPAWLDHWRRWPELRAVRNNHLYVVPADNIQRHTLRILSGARQMCAHLAAVRSAERR
ncbi:cobalamin-binding protein [Exilibacterium tricleocarpae]|uniref:Cobalamin-binding protein n=1 Tax=Exilibacterium tricleocarpae TaxID=2591008 RepID=A0A545U485_9GAMM|nr:cobalamin-binding protein [Exilibacterium tricleocarpae]